MEKPNSSFTFDEPSPYAGRWVARLHGKIIAQGITAEEAQRAA